MARMPPSAFQECYALLLLIRQRVRRRAAAGGDVDRGADRALLEAAFVLQLRDEIAARRSDASRRTR